jgi:hypothetical protein
MGETRQNHKFLLESLKERDHLKDLGVDGRISGLNESQENWASGYGLNSCGSGNEQLAGCCEHCHEISGSTKGGEFLDYMSVLLVSEEGLSPRSYLP